MKVLKKKGSIKPVILAYLKLWNQCERMNVKDDVLIKIKKFLDGCTQYVLPSSLRRIVLQRLHSANPEGAHLGEKKTWNKVREMFYWPSWKSYVMTQCQTCTVCARRKLPRRKDRNPFVLENPGYPFSGVTMDILGPLLITESGNRYFTKFVEAFAIHKQDVNTIANKLVDVVFCGYDDPETNTYVSILSLDCFGSCVIIIRLRRPILLLFIHKVTEWLRV